MVNRSTSEFIVTENWLMEWRTSAGGWTKAQLHALGLKFFPPSGWKRRLVGQRITLAMKDGFEKGRDIRVQLDPSNKLHRRIIERKARIEAES